MSTPKRPSGNRADQDSIYHRLFSHPIMIEQLVRDFVPEAMALGLDFARMERVNAKFHSRRGKRREGDLIWRLPTLGGTDVLLHVLLEFQSTVDWWMATRTQVYTGLLWQHVIKEQRLGPGDRLPPVITIVLYNGDARWNAPRDTAGLVALPHDSPLWPWQPRARYYLLDEGAFPSDDLSRRKTLAALLFRLEHCHLLDGLVDLVDEVVGWFRQHPGYDELCSLFTEIIAQAAGTVEGSGGIRVPDDLLEVRNMLATRAQEWRRQLIAEGEARGKADVLVRLLRRSFMLTDEAEGRIRSASSAQLDEWTDRFLDAKALPDIFGETTH